MAAQKRSNLFASRPRGVYSHSRTSTRTALARLTARERQIAQLVAKGCSNAEIAERLSISVQTVKNRLCEMYLKLGVKNRTGLAIALLKTDATLS